jgi:hypothetical protein
MGKERDGVSRSEFEAEFPTAVGVQGAFTGVEGAEGAKYSADILLDATAREVTSEVRVAAGALALWFATKPAQHVAMPSLTRSMQHRLQ